MSGSRLTAHSSRATKRVTVPNAGNWQVWVRTKNWVGPWKAEGAPGRFQVSLNGQKLDHVFGETGDAWMWEKGGAVELAAGEATLALHDLTGFDGRVDAVLLTQDEAFVPPAEEASNQTLRRAALGEQPG